jgi:hypothetical protein
VILIYTGETLSIPLANTSYKPAEGGLAALTQAIEDYEAEIVRYNQLRVENAGGDPGRVRADFERGMLGDNPFLLLDYGLWERPNDAHGDIYVALYFDLFTRFKYTAVGSMLYERLSAERWGQYRAVAPPGLKLLASAGTPQGQSLPAVPSVTRELYGVRWGVVAVPQPRLAPGAPDVSAEAAAERMRGFVEQAAGELKRAGCGCGVLLAAGGPRELYQELQQDGRFTVVIGAPKALAAPEGYGGMPRGGALLLPSLDGGGRQLGICHLYYTPGGDKPFQYFFITRRCADHGQHELPYREQIAAAVAKHEQAAGGRSN